MCWFLPWSFLLLLGATAAGAVIFDRHTLGRHARQLGENASAARFAGISPARVRYVIYGPSGLACGAAAVVWTARFATAHPGAAQGLELDVIAVVVLGGTRITGGRIGDRDIPRARAARGAALWPRHELGDAAGPDDSDRTSRCRDRGAQRGLGPQETRLRVIKKDAAREKPVAASKREASEVIWRRDRKPAWSFRTC